MSNNNMKLKILLIAVATAATISSIFPTHTPTSILSVLSHKRERNFEASIDNVFVNVTITDFTHIIPKEELNSSFQKPVSVSTEGSFRRVLNEYVKHSVTASSLALELYGITSFPEGSTMVTFEEIYDEYVQSYFSLNVDPTLFLDSRMTITNVKMPSIADRNLRRQQRNTEIIEDSGGKHEGSSLTIIYDQRFSYYFPVTGGMLALETLVTLPFLTQSGRNEFNSRLQDSDDLIIQDVIGVSEVNLPPQSPTIQPILPPTQPPKEPQTKVPTALPSTLPPAAPPKPTQNSSGAKPEQIRTKSPAFPLLNPPSVAPLLPSDPPSVSPRVPKTAKPTQVPKSSTDVKESGDSGGISGLIILGALMAVLFIVFAINMQYCMGEYVD